MVKKSNGTGSQLVCDNWTALWLGFIAKHATS